MIRYLKIVVALALIVLALAGCATDADRQVAKADSPGQLVPVDYAVAGDMRSQPTPTAPGPPTGTQRS